MGVRLVALCFSLLLWKCAFGRLSVSTELPRGSGFSEWFLFKKTVCANKAPREMDSLLGFRGINRPQKLPLQWDFLLCWIQDKRVLLSPPPRCLRLMASPSCTGAVIPSV